MLMDFGTLKCGSASIGKWLRMFWRTVFASYSRVKRSHPKTCDSSGTSPWAPQILQNKKVNLSLDTPSVALALEGGGWSAPRDGRFTHGKETRYPLYRRLGGTLWIDPENLASTEVRSPHRPARSELLYRLRYPGRLSHDVTLLYIPALNICASFRKDVTSSFSLDTIQVHIQRVMWTLVTRLKRSYRERESLLSSARCKNEWVGSSTHPHKSSCGHKDQFGFRLDKCITMDI